MAALRHPNVVMFMGLCLEPPCIVTEFCARGSLYDVLKKARGTPAFAQQLDWSRRISMALDAAKVPSANLTSRFQRNILSVNLDQKTLKMCFGHFVPELSWVPTCRDECPPRTHVIMSYAV